MNEGRMSSKHYRRLGKGSDSKAVSEESFLCCFIHETAAHWCLCVSGTARRPGVAKGHSPHSPNRVAREQWQLLGSATRGTYDAWGSTGEGIRLAERLVSLKVLQVK